MSWRPAVSGGGVRPWRRSVDNWKHSGSSPLVNNAVIHNTVGSYVLCSHHTGERFLHVQIEPGDVGVKGSNGGVVLTSEHNFTLGSYLANPPVDGLYCRFSVWSSMALNVTKSQFKWDVLDVSPFIAYGELIPGDEQVTDPGVNVGHYPLLDVEDLQLLPGTQQIENTGTNSRQYRLGCQVDAVPFGYEIGDAVDDGKFLVFGWKFTELSPSNLSGNFRLWNWCGYFGMSRYLCEEPSFDPSRT